MRIIRVHPAEWPASRRAAREYRSVTPDEALEVYRRRKAGWSITALMVAFDLSRRTAYRICQGTFHEVEIGPWRAVFQIGRDGWPVPTQVGRWQRSEDAA